MAAHEPLGREYLLYEEIGRGAVAVVRRAASRHGGPPLAAKLLRPELAGDRRVRELFLREEAALRALSHPAIVGVRDLVVEGGTLALVMEYVDGPDLRRYLSMRGGRLTPPEVVAVAAQTAAALAVAHQRGVVHLDLKPENLLIVRGSTPPEIRITDFGVAVLLGGAHHSVAGGTPGYTAPEIFQGGPPTPAADVWSLGVLLLELTTGRPTGDPSALPGPLGPVARDCLAADPSRRPPAVRVAAYLRQFAARAQGLPPVAPVSGHPMGDPEPATLALGFPPPQLPQPTYPPPAPPWPPRVAFIGPRDTIGSWAGRLPESTPHQLPPAAPKRALWRRGPLVALAAAVAVAAVATGLNLTSSADARTGELVTQVSVPAPVTPVEKSAGTLPPTDGMALPPLKTPAAERLRVTMAGKLDDGAGTLAISIRDGRAIAYLCDGDRLESWLTGTAKNGLLNLSGKNDTKITGLFGVRRAAGEVTVAGRTHRFDMGVVRRPSGLYRLTGQVRGAQVSGSWIVLPDGRQVGVLLRGQTPEPAPPLNLTGRSATIDGATVTGATSIDADTGEGF